MLVLEGRLQQYESLQKKKLEVFETFSRRKQFRESYSRKYINERTSKALIINLGDLHSNGRKN